MDSDQLDELLNRYSRCPLPPLAGGKGAIWNRIEERRESSTWSNFFPIVSWREIFAEPRLAVAGLVVALLMGVVPVAAATALSESPRTARNSLHLDVFTVCPGSLSVNLAADHRAR